MKSLSLLGCGAILALSAAAVANLAERNNVHAEGAPATHIVKTVTVKDGEGNTSDASWEGIEKLAMEGANEGTIQFCSIDTRFYFRMQIVDDTYVKNTDKLDFKIKIGGKTHGQQGNFDPWLTADGPMDFGQVRQLIMDYDVATTTYTCLLGYEFGEAWSVGGLVDFSINFHDAGETGTWGTGPVTSFSSYLYLQEEGDPIPEEGSSGETSETTEETTSEETETSEGPVEGVVAGPENVDLGIVVEDLAKQPTEADWANATTYNMIPVWGDTTGATGTIKVYTANQNYFFSMDVDDPMFCQNVDGPFIKVSAIGEDDSETVVLETRGNFDNWLADNVNDLGQPSLRTTTFSKEMGAGVWKEDVHVTFRDGFYGKKKSDGSMFIAPGLKMRLEVRYRDARASSDKWEDADKLHTIYFNQILTFGAEADKTIRPETPTEGEKEFKNETADKASYNKITVNWSEIPGADTYKVSLYRKNAVAAKAAADGEDAEPWTFLRVEGPFYAGEDAYSEEITGLDEGTEYGVQIAAYDNAENKISVSDLIEFRTPLRGEETSSSEEISSSEEPSSTEEPATSDTTVSTPVDSNDSTPENPDTPSNEGLSVGAWVGIGIGIAAVVLLGAGLGFYFLKKRK
ncbi:MAG: hypothetical protein ACI32C_04760 [Candidatus Enteromonas sp.]